MSKDITSHEPSAPPDLGDASNSVSVPRQAVVPPNNGVELRSKESVPQSPPPSYESVVTEQPRWQWSSPPSSHLGFEVLLHPEIAPSLPYPGSAPGSPHLSVVPPSAYPGSAPHTHREVVPPSAYPGSAPHPHREVVPPSAYPGSAPGSPLPHRAVVPPSAYPGSAPGSPHPHRAVVPPSAYPESTPSPENPKQEGQPIGFSSVPPVTVVYGTPVDYERDKCCDDSCAEDCLFACCIEVCAQLCAQMCVHATIGCCAD